MTSAIDPSLDHGVPKDFIGYVALPPLILGQRDLQEILFEHDVGVSHERLRQWRIKFGSQHVKALCCKLIKHFIIC